MSDLRLTWDLKLGGASLTIVDNDLETDDGFETAVILSLFTDRRVGPEDDLPAGETDRRGWWADQLSPVPGDLFGSRLWLLNRAKNTAEVPTRAEEYAREALAWMIEDGVVERIDVSVEVIQKGMIFLTPTLYRPKVDPAVFRFTYNWLAQEARRA